MSSRITLEDYIQCEFYQLPKIFFDKGSKYFEMSMNAKVLYSLLKNRLELSMKNNWVNESGEVYLIMTRLEAAEMLGVGETMARKTFHELEMFGLVEDIRQGLTKPNLIFISKCEIECCSRPSKSDGQNHQNLTASNNNIKKNENIKENTKEKTETNPNVITVSPAEALNRIYSAYPRKKGKANGYSKALAFMTKGVDVAGFGRVKLNHEELYCAVRHYAIECEKSNTSQDYMMHFSTFMNKSAVEYAELAKSSGYEDYMLGKYGKNWRKVKFIYTE